MKGITMAVTAQRTKGAARDAAAVTPPEAAPPFEFPDDLTLDGEYRRAEVAEGDGGVLVGKASDGGVFLVDGKRPTAGAMHFDPKEWLEFKTGVRAGDFD